jgi:hypothetical protein
MIHPGETIMAIKFKNLSIRRDELTVLKVAVAEWEVPLLQLVNGEEMVTIEPGEPWSDNEPPSVQDEYQRLFAKYRTPAEENGAPGQRAVTLVYGAFGASPLLKQAIQAATFTRTTDLLGLDVLRANAAAATAASNKANADLANAEAANAETEDEDDEGEETPAERAKREKREKAAAAKSAKAAADAGSTTGKSLL